MTASPNSTDTANSVEPPRQTAKSVAATLLAVCVACAISWAGSQGSVMLGGFPLFALCGALAFAINWLAFVPAYLARTERYYDLAGSFTYLSVVATALLGAGRADPRSLLLGIGVALWSVRLGGFLFVRIRRAGRDRRFDSVKHSFPRFLLAWTLQGLWVFLTLSCALAAISTEIPRPLAGVALLGLVIFLAGFALEVVADRQKRRFHEVASNRGRFIQSGLWAWSRHPNYLGEIIIWCGITVIALPVVSGWQYATLISPAFVYVLLTQISGVPLLEERANERWGRDLEYQAYRERTPVLFLRAPKSN